MHFFIDFCKQLFINSRPVSGEFDEKFNSFSSLTASFFNSFRLPTEYNLKNF